ncbi:molecular chaperone DnaJ [Novosphingobium sp. KCTC 2891]|uniref:molecular chaperone DnaJ n=1 Tax=Novosphingobium sp. KCTC 2891 TaxID=2989730 RepID=UPI00222166F3|nr:molecular chaperone DnaJ [Novosphingobium sp. KCTC 2891]MCW1382375.1 molecular chaperone DnaJ [Novosphingobium sp. KCTC 2891]
MTKLLWLVVLASIAVRMLAGRWPWELLRENERSVEEKRARNLLGVATAANRQDIIDAHRRLITRVHPDRGGSSEAVHEANAARDLLLGRLGERGRGS